MTGTPDSGVALRCTVVRSDSGLVRQWCLCVPVGTTWSSIAQQIGATEPSYAGPHLIAGTHCVGVPPLINEVVISDLVADAAPPHLLDIVVIEGPCVGARAALTDQPLGIGRGPDNHLVLDDSDLSRHHCQLRIDQGRAVVCDANSTNGSYLDGSPVGSQQLEMRAGQRLRIGGSTLVLERSSRPSEPLAVDTAGRYLVHRPPRNQLRVADLDLVEPAAPAIEKHRGFPWVAAITPLILAVVMVLVLGNLMFAMFALLSPVMVIAQYAGDRNTTRGRHHDQQSAHAQNVERFQQDCAAAVRAEQGMRRQIAPPVATAARDVQLRTARLWNRAPTHEDFGAWRVGIGTTESRIRLRAAVGESRHLRIDDVPVVVPMREHSVVGISGALRHLLTQSALLQLATWHSPGYLRIFVFCMPDHARAPWVALAALPHVTPHPMAAPRIFTAEGEDTAITKMCATLAIAGDHDSPHTLVVVDGAVGNIPAVADLITNAARCGLAVLALAEQPRQLPPACTCIIIADKRDQAYVDDVPVRPDLPIAELVASTARALGAIADADPSDAGSQIPDSVDFIALIGAELGFDVGDPAEVLRGWHSQPIQTRALLGQGANGPIWTDLATDGPHALIAGTTGAGKSELLQTMITSLALTNSPDRLSFVLIDYKGGAAFAECARLPHTLGLVTDLDAHLTSRALRSLEAEVRRRERMLASCGAADISRYDALAPEVPLARLFIVIDEFRVLAEELPDFIEGLVRIAAVGRSLGIHLILATQRPAGVVSADMRANLNLRIALRVRDSCDSHDVIESDAAAVIPAELPGRAILRTGGGPPILFQTAWTGGPLPTAEVPIRVARIDPRTGAPNWPPAQTAERESCALTLLQETISVAAVTGRIHTPQSPWLQPLPSAVSHAEVQQQMRTRQLMLDLHLRRSSGTGFVVGLVDLPAEQRQEAIGWHPGPDGNLSIVGGPRSGRTTAARTLAYNAARELPSGRLHLYVLDGGGSLLDLARLPHCGAVISRQELSRTTRLVDWLCGLIRQRQSRPCTAGGEAATDPLIVLVIDGWEIFQEMSNEHTVGDLEDRLGQILRDGASVGVTVVATGGRALMSGRTGAFFSSTIVLRMTDPTDLLMAGLRSSQIPAQMPPGRGVLLPGGQELQATLPDHPWEPGCTQTDGSTTETGPVHIAELPARVHLADLVPTPHPADLVLCGCTVDGPDGLPTGPLGEAGWLVCGPPRSGRSNVLSVLAVMLAPHRTVGWISTGSTPAGTPTDVVRLPFDDPGCMHEWCLQHPDAAILIDDVDQLGGFPAESVVLEHLARNRSTGAIVCATGPAGELATSYRGLAPELRRRQTGILLQPGRHDGDVFGIRTGPADRPRPGRGLLVIRGEIGEIQIAGQASSARSSSSSA